MIGENIVILLGNVGEIDYHETKDGKSVTNIKLATTKKLKSGEHQTEWHNVVCWGKLAEWAVDRIEKSDFIHIRGSLTNKIIKIDEHTVKCDLVTAEHISLTQKKDRNKQKTI